MHRQEFDREGKEEKFRSHMQKTFVGFKNNFYLCNSESGNNRYSPDKE